MTFNLVMVHVIGCIRYPQNMVVYWLSIMKSLCGVIIEASLLSFFVVIIMNILKKQFGIIWRGWMKIKCKKCGITLEANNIDFHDVARYSALQCMDEGTHVFVGVVE